MISKNNLIYKQKKEQEIGIKTILLIKDLLMDIKEGKEYKKRKQIVMQFFCTSQELNCPIYFISQTRL